jgi:hypothetical protein
VHPAHRKTRTFPEKVMTELIRSNQRAPHDRTRMADLQRSDADVSVFTKQYGEQSKTTFVRLCVLSKNLEFAS